jgi:anti-sigma B factor antagonist
MNINTLEGERYTVIGLEGDVDLSCSPDARKSILDVLHADKNLLIDLGKVTYIDSSGVASLVEGYQTAKKQSLKFGLVGVSEAAMSVLKLARLDKVFPIHDSVEEYEKVDG